MLANLFLGLIRLSKLRILTAFAHQSVANTHIQVQTAHKSAAKLQHFFKIHNFYKIKEMKILKS